MPGLPQRNANVSNANWPTCSAGPVSVNGIWSKHRDDVTFDQLRKFWSELSPHARQELLRIDKQTLLEQARKNLYCSRCNGLLLEGFSQIVMYGKSLQQESMTATHLSTGRTGASKNEDDSALDKGTLNSQDDIQDPSVHPWGGLVATRDGILTLLDCFLDSKSLKTLQNVFDSARVREREREMLYPDACGGGGRGWISQGMANYGRGHATRETCALHTARLSCDTLVDFWSALGDEARMSLLRMKEEDFIERLMYRFDSKRFCRDCRRNVIREFKELKELKRMRREPHCTSWFCVADTAFQYEVSDDMIQADWHESFTDMLGTYHHFEWAVGTGEGKSDILEFEDVGMNGSVQVNGLDLGSLSACFITLRAWKLDGRCTELSVKAHAMKGQPCVHRRLVVGDGFVTITKGESIRRFFEHAEEAEEEEDDDSVDKDGNELDGEGSRPQKHAKSPELAREFLLDAATVIFKEQVEKAFREGTARQNAHIIFVCLALKLLEERVHVACKEIITLEKQTKLLEEEEKEKREEEERKERKRTKEREKKLRRKERLKGKERDREKKCVELMQSLTDSEMLREESSPTVHQEPDNTASSEDTIREAGDKALARPLAPDIQEQSSSECITLKMQDPRNDSLRPSCNDSDGEIGARDGNSYSFIIEQSKSSRRKLRFKKEFHQLDLASRWCDRNRSAFVNNDNGALIDEPEPRIHGGYKEIAPSCINGMNRQLRNNLVKSNIRICAPKFSEKSHCSNNRMRDRCDIQSCSCKHGDYRAKDGQHVSSIRVSREIKTVNRSESAPDVSRPLYRNHKYNHGYYQSDSCGIPKSKLVTGNITSSRDMLHAKKVWEPTESRKKYLQRNSESDVTLRQSSFKVNECGERRCSSDEIGCGLADNILNSSDEPCLYEVKGDLGKVGGLNNYQSCEDNNGRESRNPILGTNNCQDGFGLGANSPSNSKDAGEEDASTYSMNGSSDPIMSNTSSSDNCSSCLSEGDSSTASSSTQNAESWSISDSEDASQQSEGKETTMTGENGFQKCPYDGLDDKNNTNGGGSFTSRTTSGVPVAGCFVGANFPGNPPTNNVYNPENGRITVDMGSQQHHMVPPLCNQGIHLPMIPAPSAMAYYHQSPSSWSAAPSNGLLPFSQPNRYIFTNPLGYGPSVNQPPHFCMQYGALQQPLPTSILNVGQPPMYRSVNKFNGATSKEQKSDNSKLPGAQEATNVVERSVLNGQTPPEAPSCGEDGHTRISAKLYSDNKSFSLFHFGGPIAVATGNNLNPVSLEESVGDFSSNSLADRTQADLACTQKETTVEEYSLFAESNATRFSFF